MLAEILVSFLVFTLAVAGAVYGYTQTNRMADYTAMSLAAQSEALQGAERARGAAWNPYKAYPPVDQLNLPLNAPTNTAIAVFTNIDFMDIPSKGSPSSSDFAYWVTNYVYVTPLSYNPNLRQIRSDAIWTYPPTGQLITTTVMDLRAPDQ